MRVDLFDFELPAEFIALEPVSPRDAARMLVVKPDSLSDRVVRDLPDFFEAGDVLVINDTKVIPAQLEARRFREGSSAEGAKIDVTLHKQVATDRWRAFIRPAKRVRVADHLVFGDTLSADVVDRAEGGEAELAFNLSGSHLLDAIIEYGVPPLPPYIASKRDVRERDVEDYQTVYARDLGSVAAPTAGLHFTPELLDALEAKGVEIVKVTLHVGAGTFLPMKVDDTADHKMHAEWGIVPEEVVQTINSAKKQERNIISVGTTSLRILESAAARTGALETFEGETDIFITPGYEFKVVDRLMTNFHLPKSTLFMLVSAFAGLEAMQAAYAHAVGKEYRFYSYGDACLLYPLDT